MAPLGKKMMKRTRVVKKSSPTMNKTIATLKKQVKKLNTISYNKVPIVSIQASNSTLGGLTQTPTVIPLMNWFASALPQWGYQGADLNEVTKAYINSFTVRIDLQQSNEPDLIRHAIFLVSLKDCGADSTTFDPATGQLSLIGGTHHSFGTNQELCDQTVVSTRFFNVHGTWRTYTGGIVGGQTVQPALRKKSFHVKPTAKLYQNPKGNMFGNAAFSFPKDPSQNYFLLCFNDNLTGDLESPKISVSTIYDVAIAS